MTAISSHELSMESASLVAAQIADAYATKDDISPPDVWMTRPELAKRWKVAVATLARWAVDGTGPRYAVFGRAARYNLRDIEAFEQLAFTTDASRPA